MGEVDKDSKRSHFSHSTKSLNIYMHIILICWNFFFIAFLYCERKVWDSCLSRSFRPWSERYIYIYNENIYGTVRSGFIENGIVKYISREVMNWFFLFLLISFIRLSSILFLCYTLFPPINLEFFLR